MKLFFRKVGEGKPLIILHGLFGLGDNWSTLAKSYADAGFSCYLVDQRNHGRSPHSKEFNYLLMADDVAELIDSEKLGITDVIGHSMGGKTAMFTALYHQEKVGKLIVADMGPGFYPPYHQTIIAALQSIDTGILTSRKEAEEQLRISIHEESTIQFLLKNLYWKEDKKLAWRFGLDEITSSIENTGEALPSDKQITRPCLFVRGEKSGYVNADQEEIIQKIFTNYQIETIADAGHWLHADQPDEFLKVTLAFLENKNG
jgi:esterase